MKSLQILGIFLILVVLLSGCTQPQEQETTKENDVPQKIETISEKTTETTQAVTEEKTSGDILQDYANLAWVWQSGIPVKCTVTQKEGTSTFYMKNNVIKGETKLGNNTFKYISDMRGEDYIAYTYIEEYNAWLKTIIPKEQQKTEEFPEGNLSFDFDLENPFEGTDMVCGPANIQDSMFEIPEGEKVVEDYMELISEDMPDGMPEGFNTEDFELPEGFEMPTGYGQ